MFFFFFFILCLAKYFHFKFYFIIHFKKNINVILVFWYKTSAIIFLLFILNKEKEAILLPFDKKTIKLEKHITERTPVYH